MTKTSWKNQWPAPGRLLQFAGAALLLGIFWYFFIFSSELHYTDVDRFFHLSVFRDSQAGTLLSLPQADDIAWKHLFVSREYLFHFLGAKLFQFGGETLPIDALRIAVFLMLLVLFLECAREVPPWAASLFVLIVTILNSYFFFRITFFRPFVFALFLFFVILMALRRRLPYVAGIFSCLYALSYHTVYVPIFMVATFFLAHKFAPKDEPDPKALKTAYASGIGILVGLVLNPYFPGNITMLLSILKVAVGHIDIPKDLIPPDLTHPGLSNYLIIFAIPLALIAAAVSLRWPKRSPAPRQALTQDELFVLVLTAGFWLLSVGQIRIMEYALPLSAIFFAQSFRPLFRAENRRGMRAAVLVALLTVSAAALGQSWPSLRQKPLDSVFTKIYINVFAALRSIPAEAKGKKVYNCNWADGSLLYYARPDLRFVDLVDFMLLREHSKEKFQARYALNHARFPDPDRALKEAFHADYVLCPLYPLTEQLLKHPQYEVIFPLPGDPFYKNSAVYVFRRKN